MNTIQDMTLAGVRALYNSGLKPEQLLQQLRQTALEVQDRNIFIHLLSEDEVAPFIESLQESDPSTKPLWGVPFVVKDNIDIAGIPTTAACEAFAYTPEQSATVVQRLVAQGALPVGKANLDQFATGLNGTRSPFGACGNSFDPSLLSGGSSAGSAVAVALGLATFSLGTDTAGSGRVPACFNNLVGVKPTRGLVSAHGVVPACRSLDCVSLFALHCDDANEVLAVMEGFDDLDAYSRSNAFDNRSETYGRFADSLTLGVIPDRQLRFFGDEQYETAYRKTIDVIRSSGVTLREINYEPFDEVARLLYEGPWVAERYIACSPLIEEQPDAMHPVVKDIVAAGAHANATSLFKAQYRLTELNRICQSQLAGVDALLTPTAGRLFSIEEMLEEPVKRNSELGYYMNFVNLLDLAAIAVPTALTSSGLPFGITLSAPAFTDRRLLSIANRIQQLCPTPLGAGSASTQNLTATPVGRQDLIDLVVCGAHMQGMPLNFQLAQRGATFVESGKSAGCYQFYALQEGPVRRPAMIRVAQGGAEIDIEVWRLPSAMLGSFLLEIAPPLGLGKVELADGRWVCGFIAEACAVQQGTDITHFGGWRQYLESGTAQR